MQVRFEKKQNIHYCNYVSIVIVFSWFVRNTSKALTIKDQKRSHVSVWNWIQRFALYRIYKRKIIAALIIDETVIQIRIVSVGYGFVLNQYIGQCLESTLQRREICSLLKNSSDH